ncbi:MAG: hypothetical protein IKP88_10510 [Lachnospiraceae bacterium]|nr:hypothetical protein [Lachnospiraceae bacterium]
MSIKGVMKRFLLIFSAILIFVFNTSVVAAEQTARLKYCLENDHLYMVLTPDFLGSYFAANKSGFKDKYEDAYIAMNGGIQYSSLSGGSKSIKVFGNNTGVEVDTSKSSVNGMVGQLKIGDRVTVYGKIDVIGITSGSFKLVADYIVINPEKELPLLAYVYYPDKVYKEEEIKDLARDGHVSFNLPWEWKDEYVMGRLTNNDVNGYQFFLNAISPQNLEYPENFYMFYFKYETYLDKVKKNPDSFDIKDIEKLIIKNILGVLTGDFKVDISTVKFGGDKKFDYCSTVYKPAEGRDYRLEFFFKNDSTGIVCMLYLYYPDDNTNNHIRDVAYVIHSISN